MQVLSSEVLRSLAQRRDKPVVSILLPTEKAGPPTRQSPIRFKNLVFDAEKKLKASNDCDALRERLKRECEPRFDDHGFWQHQTEGLAVFCDEDDCEFFHLAEAPPEISAMGNRHTIKPLLRMTALNEPFFLLALSGNDCRLYRGDRDALQEVSVEGLPRSLEHALRHEVPEKSLQFHTGAASPSGGRPAVFHGQGSSIDDRQDRFLRYFRICDHALGDFLKRENLPLILAAVESNLPLYRHANTYGGLVEDRLVAGNPDDLPRDELHRRAQQVVESLIGENEEQAIEELRGLVGTSNASTEVREISPAVREGRVRRAFVAADDTIHGRADPETGSVNLDARVECDLLNEVAAETLLLGGEVFALRKERIPGNTGVAAIYRF